MKNALFLAGVVSLTASAQATVIFDEYTPGVSWDVDWGSVNTTNTQSGAQSIQAWAGNGQIVFIPPAPARPPLTIGSESVLDFYINTVTASSVSVNIGISTPTQTVEYDWGVGGVYEVDGVTQSSGITTDADVSTWQHVKFDVTQSYDFWGASGTEYRSLTASDQIYRIAIINSGNTLVDAVQMTGVPEPTSLAILGVAGMLMLRRKR